MGAISSQLTAINTRPTWAEIDLSAIKSNIAALRKNVPNSKFMAVVKADAYGHGAIAVARAADADYLGVATPTEGAELRDAGIDRPIVVLSPIVADQITEMRAANLIPSVTSLEIGKAFDRVHVKVNSGMNRSGVSLSDAVEFIRALGSRVEGVFTHLAGADDVDRTSAYDQFDRFELLLRDLRAVGIRPPIAHICNTAAILDMPEMALDMVRAGIGIYGLYPSRFVGRRVKLTPALKWKTKVLETRRIEAGERVSYNGTFVAERATNIALLPVGYADGYRRALSNRGEVMIRGRRAKIAGRVCMDLIVVDCGELKPEIGEEVILLGDDLTADEMAEWLGTNNYEIVTQISRRVPRRYL